MLLPSIVGRKNEVLEKAKWIFTPAHAKELSSWAKVDSLPLYQTLYRLALSSPPKNILKMY
jgi:hypothetical protein